MGSSSHAAHPAVTALAATGVRAAMVDAAELLHFRLPAVHERDVVVLVSQSGASAETVAVARALRERREPPRTLAVTNDTAGPLAGLVDDVVPTMAGPETGPSTMTFGGAIVVLAALARSGTAAMADFDDDVAATATAVERLVADPDLPDRLLAWHGGRATTVFVGRGGGRAAAEMAALTIEESVGTPVAAAAGCAVPARSPRARGTGDGGDRSWPPSRRPARWTGGSPTTSSRSAPRSSPSATPAATAVPGWIGLGPLHPTLAPAAAIVPSQLLAYRLAVAAGRSPGAYVHATKVTTRE